MNKNNTTRVWLLLATIAILPNSLLAADCPTDIKAVTSSDVNVSIDVLTYQVKPLTKCELQVEAQAWLLQLKGKVAEISKTQIAAIYKEEEIDTEEDVEDAQENVKEASQEADRKEKTEAEEEVKQALLDAKTAKKKLSKDKELQKSLVEAQKTMDKKGEQTDAPSTPKEAKENLKTALIKHVTALTTERTLLIDRFKIVLAELDVKGGKAEEYDTYITAVTGIKVDVTDASATWTAVTGWLMSAEGGLRWALNFIKFAVILIMFFLLSIIAGKATKKACSKSRHFSTLLRKFLVLSSRRLVLLIGLFVALSALEINIGPVIAIIGAAGFVIAFALQNSLSNFASGILMLLYRPFDVNDIIKVASTQGTVESMNLLSTQLRTADNQLVVVPNNSVWGDVIVNITGISTRRVDLVFGIGYSDDIDKAQKILQEIVDDYDRILKKPEAMIRLHELADSSVNFVCRPWVKPEDYWDTYWHITREVKRRFDAEGISIPFPQQDIHIHQETLKNSSDE